MRHNCKCIPVNNDGTLEDFESFTVIIEEQSPLDDRIKLNRIEGLVIILDINDGTHTVLGEGSSCTYLNYVT